MIMFYNGSKAEAEKYTKRFTDIGKPSDMIPLYYIRNVFVPGPLADLRQEMPYKNMNGLMVSPDS